MHFEGTELFAAEPSHLYAYLAHAGRLARALREGDVLDDSADHASWKVRPKFAFMAGTLDTTATVVAREEAHTLRYRIVSTGVGSSSTMETRLVVSPHADGAQVKWTGDLIELGGLLKMVPRVMLQTAAFRTITDVWEAVRKDLAASPDSIA